MRTERFVRSWRRIIWGARHTPPATVLSWLRRTVARVGWRGRLKASHRSDRYSGIFPAVGSPTNWECREATLAEILADPLVEAIMDADGVDPKKLSETLCKTAVKAGRHLADQESGNFKGWSPTVDHKRLALLRSFVAEGK
jgi:hypothetical protein